MSIYEPIYKENLIYFLLRNRTILVLSNRGCAWDKMKKERTFWVDGTILICIFNSIQRMFVHFLNDFYVVYWKHFTHVLYFECSVWYILSLTIILHRNFYYNNDFRKIGWSILFHSSWMFFQRLQSVVSLWLDNADFKRPKGQKLIDDASGD